MASRDVLDMPMLEIARGVSITMRDLTQNVFVTGVTGGGKTSGPGRHLLETLLRSGAGGLVLCAKPGEADEIRALCAKLGRLDSLIVCDGRNGRFNPLLNRLAKLGADGINGLVEYLLRIVEMVRNASALPGDNGDAFWIDELRTLLRHAVPVVYAATGTVRIADLIEFVRTAPTSPEQMADPNWQRLGGFFIQCFLAAARTLDDRTGARLISFWRDDFACRDSKLRSNVIACFSMLDRFNHGWLRDMLCEGSNIYPALCFHGVVIVLDMPRATHGEDGIIAQLVLKDTWQDDVLGRNDLAPQHRERLVFCYADECQEFVTSRDADFLAMSRSSRSCTIYLTQSLPAMYSRIGGATAHDRTHHLIANFGTRIFCANGCAETNEWASRTIGKAVQRRSSFNESQGTNSNYGMSMGEGTSWNQPAASNGWFGPRVAPNSPSGSEGGGDNWARNRGHGSNYGTSHGWSEQLDYIIEPGFFARGLKTGGPANDNRVSAIWYQAGRRFAATGGNFTQVEFQQ